MNSEFLKWFEAQHGKRQGCIQLDYELKQAIKTGETCKAELERRLLWDEKLQSALYAWTARTGTQE
jgi:hypothetical protein